MPDTDVDLEQVEGWADRLNRLDVQGDTKTLVEIIDEMYRAAGLPEAADVAARYSDAKVRLVEVQAKAQRIARTSSDAAALREQIAEAHYKQARADRDTINCPWQEAPEWCQGFFRHRADAVMAVLAEQGLVDREERDG